MAAKGTKDNPYKRSDDAPASVYFRGSNAVKKLEADLGRKLTTEEKRIVALEGYVDGYYKDSKGVLTRGVGQTGDYAKGPHAHSGFNKAFKDHVKRAEKSVPSLNTYSPEARAEIIQAEYRGDLGQGKKFRKKLNAADKVYADPNMLSPYTNYSYKDAATEFLDNKDYKNAKRGRSGVDERMEAVANAVRERGNQNANVSRVPSHLTGLPTLKPREEVITETVTEEGPGFYDRFTSGLKELLPYNEGGTVNKLMNQQEQRPMINSQAMPQPQPQSQAQGLASLGRGGDSMMVHMQPQEVAGLQQMAQANGTSLTTNPMTGMPEAFNLGGVFRAALPIAAGYLTGGAATPFLGAGTATASAITAGALTGAGVAAISGEDVLAGGLSGGLGGYSGMGLETALGGSAIPAGAGAGAGSTVNPALVSSSAPIASTASAGSVGSFNPALDSSLTTAGGGAAPLTQGSVFDPSINPGASPIDTMKQNLGVFETGYADDLGLNARPGEQYLKKSFVPGDNLDVAMKLGSPAVSLGLGGLEVSDFYDDDIEFSDPRDKYDPYKRLNLNQDTGIKGALASDSGLRLYAEGGPINLNTKTQAPSGRGLNLNTRTQGPSGRGLNLNTGMTGVSPADLEAARLKAIEDAKPKGHPMEFVMGQGMRPVGAIEAGPLANYSSNLSGTGYTFKGKQYGMPGYAEGGYLKGPGDGMSDDIPATINGEQPAALADGEFVVPADVVSHLGNGSSEAGSKQLYAMMDRIRKARTGRESQGKEIKPKKYMPR